MHDKLLPCRAVIARPPTTIVYPWVQGRLVAKGCQISAVMPGVCTLCKRQRRRCGCFCCS
uniref:Uncharacterized protein n=1 Tax=Ciona intestinalis TaxID=7719 RepID=H2XTQ8_CIOIN